MMAEELGSILQLDTKLDELIQVFCRRGLVGEGCFEPRINAIGERGDLVAIMVVQDLSVSCQLSMIGRAVPITLAEVLQLAFGSCVCIGIIIGVLDSGRECFICSEVDSSYSLVQVWFEPVRSIACQTRGCISDFSSVIGVSGWV